MQILRLGARATPLATLDAPTSSDSVTMPVGDSAAAHVDALRELPHRRFDLLTGEWVLVAPHRMRRPWQGQVERLPDQQQVPYDPACYLCPGNTRANGERNPAYEDTFVFDNDFAALVPVTAPALLNDDELLLARSETGLCRVICFSPRHDLSIAELPHPAVRRVVDLWADEYERLGARPEIGHVQIFENKGEVMGCSNPHPHGQIWAQGSVPCAPAREGDRFATHHARHGRTTLEDYLTLELRRAERIVCQNDGFVALVPFWAVWPFETLVISRRPVPHLGELTGGERDALADIVHQVTVRYDNLFEISFPYSAGLHQAPTDGAPHPEWHLHVHFYPPLLRSATVRKFLVGYEMLAEAQRDLTAEAAAERLRAVSATHYLSARTR